MSTLITLALCSLSLPALFAAERAVFRAEVDVVTLAFSVTDGRNQHVSGLTPDDVRILEDGVEQKLRSFTQQTSSGAHSNVFILFDTSNCMYDLFPHVEDAIADFMRGLNPADSVALYTFSRNLLRLSPLSPNHQAALSNLRQAVAGDDTALYDALLVTVNDASRIPGRKSIVIFTNGPDNRSVSSPDDVRRVAAEAGISIYFISTRPVDEITNNAMVRVAESTGGKSYIGISSGKREFAFNQIQSDIRTSYVVTYVPTPNPNRGFRQIEVQVKRDTALQVHTRKGYTPNSGSAGTAR